MSDDDWLPDRLDPPAFEPRPSAPNGSGQGAAMPETSQASAPAPRLLLRPKDAEDRAPAAGGSTPPPKTLKQKEAEYAAARARIFGTKGGGSAGGRGGRGRGGCGGGGCSGRGDGYRGRGGGGVSRGQGSGRGQGGPRRKRDDDLDDPDYDRNAERYAPRLAPQFDEPFPQHSSARYIAPTYENEFPALGR